MHPDALASGEDTCIDCHKGIAHELPDMKTGHWPEVKCFPRVAKSKPLSLLFSIGNIYRVYGCNKLGIYYNFFDITIASS
jgi:hypothetical protein